MKVCIVYDSKYGNGKKCVEYLQHIIAAKKYDVEIFSVHETKPSSLPKADYYIFSSPTHIGSPTRKMKKFLRNLSVIKANYALMTTCIDFKTKALQKMEKILQNKGMIKASDGIKIKVNGMKGSLEEGYKQKLEEFADKMFSTYPKDA